MSTSVNMCAISGNLTRDGEVRSTQGGTAILSFDVAVNERRKNQQTGEWEDRPSFISCSLFGNRAMSLAQYLTKGTKVFVQGHLRQSSWEAQDGSKRSKVEVIVDEIDLGSRPQGHQAAQEQAPTFSAPQQAPTYSMPQQAPAYQAPQQQYAAPQQSFVQPNQFTQMAQQLTHQTQQQVELYDEEIPF